MSNTTTLSKARYHLASASLGNLAFFGGGNCSGNQLSNVVDIFNSTSQTWSNTTLSQARYQLAASTSVNNRYALFGGGHNQNAYFNIIDVYNVSNGQWFTLTLPLSESRASLVAITINELVVFRGGGTAPNCPTVSNAVDVYNMTSGLHWTFNLSVARCFSSSAVFGDLVLIAGGGTKVTSFNTIDIFNITSQSWNTTTLSEPRFLMGSTSCRNQIFFGGGALNWNPSSVSNVVDIFIFNNILSTPAQIQIPSSVSASEGILFYQVNKTIILNFQ
jgi:hypothetical protein